MAKRKKHTRKAPVSEVKKPKAPLKDIHLPGWAYAVIAACVLAVIVFIRLSHLSYDPPVDIFWSQDLWTDPPQYTSYARNAILFGNWNPLGDPWLTTFIKNSTGALAYIVFAIFGVGVWQSNLVAVLFNLGTVILFSLAVTALKNRTAGMLCAVFLGTSYIFLTYGRVPFLENTMNFWLAAAVLFIAWGLRRPGWFLAAGVTIGIAAFFGKIIALHAVPVFLLFTLFVGWRNIGQDRRKKWLLPAAYLSAGVLAVAIFWYPYVYLQTEGAYFSAKSTVLYGSPEGLQSISGFFNRLFSFGSDTRLFARLPVMAIFGFPGLALAFLPLAHRGNVAERLRRIKPEYLLVGLWFWVAYFALMPWNYRPLRYETVLLIPLAGAAAMALSDLVRRVRSVAAQKSDVSQPWAVILGTLLFLLPVYHLVTVQLAAPRQGKVDGQAAIIAIVIALVCALIISAAWRKIATLWRRMGASTRIPEIIVALAVLATLTIQGRMILGWWEHGQRALAGASRHLGELLDPEAVLVGSYATGLTLENRLKNVVYMFGTSRADFNPSLFDDYPITHLAIIDDKSNPVFSNYEDVAALARKVTSFRIGNRDVGIFRVAERSPNTKAQAYQPTAYEEAMRYYDLYKEDSMLIYIERFARDHPDNFNVARSRGFLFWRDSTYDSASLYFEKAARLYPDDYAVHYRLAECEMNLFQETGRATHIQKAQAHFKEVLRLVPNDPRLRASLEPIINR